MKHSDFRRMMEDEFGSANAAVIASTLVLPTLDQTADASLASGRRPREVWLDVCRLQGVPPERQLGVDRPVRDTGVE